jgi:hypothetical protein
MSNASGQALTATSTNLILGTALETGASGRIIEIVFHPRGAV